MPFPPAVSPHADHFAPETAPDGSIELRIRCRDDDCVAGDLQVSVTSTAGDVIAEGPVTCTGGQEPHSLPLSGPRELAAVRVRVRFTCGGMTAVAWEGRLWLRTSAATAGAARKPATANKGATAKQGATARKAAAARKGATARKGAAKRATSDAAITADLADGAEDEATRKTTRPHASRRREAPPAMSAADRIGRRLDAVPDRIDIRDWLYQPRLAALPARVVNCDRVPKILDQGEEGACTGFAQAAIINQLLHAQGVERFVSPYMLYELARRYDEWPGEEYEGSSARGAMMGWVRHGVCLERSWVNGERGVGCLDKMVPWKTRTRSKQRSVREEARDTPGGAFYRVQHGQVRDMHAAIAEVGAVYCTLMVHEGWGAPSGRAVTVKDATRVAKGWRLPVITRRGRATDGHAIAIVGYAEDGFVVQNSWGEAWGNAGFALLPYEDFLLHVTDVWAMQTGVPVSTDVWQEPPTEEERFSGLQRAPQAAPLEAIRPFVVNVGNNGELSGTGDYWTTEGDVARLLTTTIADATHEWPTRRILLYLHGGLNSERSVAQRIIAFREVMLANGIYPLHVMWESGLGETLTSLLRDQFTDVDDRARGVREWMQRLRDNLVEAKDRSLEVTLARPGGAIWREMKENARLASHHPDGRGGMEILCRHAGPVVAKGGGAVELHIVAHSAGSIFAAYALDLLARTGVTIRSVQFLAPAITTELFRERVLPHVRAGTCPLPTLYLLSDAGERDDTVGPYGKSLLFLVSNAFERARSVPLLGMERFVSEAGEVGGRYVEPDLQELFSQEVQGLPSLIVAGDESHQESTDELLRLSSLSRSETHGGFDNDPDTMNAVLARVLGEVPARAFTLRDLRY